LRELFLAEINISNASFLFLFTCVIQKKLSQKSKRLFPKTSALESDEREFL